MNSISLATLRTRVLTTYDLPTNSTTTWATTAILLTEINASLQAYYSLLFDCYGDDYFTTVTDLTTTPSTATTSLPSTFYRLLDLVWLRGTDDVVPIEKAEPRHAKIVGMSAQSWDSWQPRYAIHGSTLRWLPTPSGTYSVRLTYAALPADLSADGDTASFGPGWEHYVIHDVCVKLAQREEKDPSLFGVERDVWEQRIRDAAPLRGDNTGSLFLDRSDDNVSDYEWRNRLTRRWY